MRWIHDVTTDPADPPRYVVLREVRLACVNGVDYSGLDAAAHRLKHPDLATMRYAVNADTVFETALAFANSLGWEIAGIDKAEGRIEATATTRIMRFKDDVVIRIRAMAGGTLLDARSASRVGKSDLGANAQRLRTYLDIVNSILKTNTSDSTA